MSLSYIVRSFRNRILQRFLRLEEFFILATLHIAIIVIYCFLQIFYITSNKFCSFFKCIKYTTFICFCQLIKATLPIITADRCMVDCWIAIFVNDTKSIPVMYPSTCIFLRHICPSIYCSLINDCIRIATLRKYRRCKFNSIF